MANGYPEGIAAAEALIRARIARTKWASDARLLRLVADEVHNLTPEPEDNQ